MKLKESLAVWVMDAAIAKDNLYNIGHVVSIEGDKVTVETEAGGKRQEIVTTAEQCFHTNYGPDVPDHCQLVHLSPPTLLENTRARFETDKIYTYVGEILVAINPFKWGIKIADGKPIYDESVMEQCKGKKLHNSPCGPHAFAISEKAYVAMKKKQCSQCVVVSGESGSGKTETNKQLMNYLVFRGTPPGAAKSDLIQKILDTNPILEGFGNAKTTRNKNSSRFGRYVLVRFSAGYQVIGAQVRVFLLERSRVTAAGNAGERAYHALYQVVCEGTYCQPTDPKSHYYLSLSDTQTIDGVDDVSEFNENNAALISIGLSSTEASQMWGMLASMLYLGNISFGDGAQAAIADAGAVTKIEGLLGVTGLSELLVKRSIKIGAEVTRIEHEPKQAMVARDALVKIMYARLFDFFIKRINLTIDSSEQSSRYIGLLDVYGFEFFAVNSFEQLCINFANEKLQQFFLTTVFDNEATQYKEEGVPWTPIEYADNKDIIALCEAGTTGIYSILDNQCRTPNASGKTFCAAVHKQHAKSPVLSAPKVTRKETRSKDDHFIVKHFAGDVVYFSGEFLDKNNDSLDADVEGALLQSSTPLIVEICTPDDAGGGGKKKKTSFASVGAKFVKSLATLMKDLSESQAHFVRCIKPNPEAKPNKIHGKSVMEQLRMSGTLDAVKLIQAGYPSRIPYEDLYSKYRSMMPEKVQSLPPPDFCEIIAAVCDIGKEEYALGVTRMFFKLGSAALLEELAEADPAEVAPILQEKLAAYEKKAKARPMVEKTLRMWVHKRRYKVVIAEKRAREAEERRIAEEKRKKEEEAKRRAEEEAAREREAEERRKAEAAAKAAAEAGEAAVVQQKAEAAGISVEEEVKKEEKAAAAASMQLQAADAMVHDLEESHDDVHAAVAASGGITGVIKMAGDHAGSADVQAHFVGLMRDLCVTDEIADEIAAAGGVEKIMESAHRHFDSPEVIMEVADAIRNLTAAEHIADKVSAVGGVEVLIDAAERHVANEAVCRAVVGALWALSVHDPLVSKLVNRGAVRAALGASKAMPADEDVQSSAAALIRNLAINEDVRWTVAEKGGITLLISAAASHPTSPEVCAQVACALWNLSQTTDVASEVAASGAIDVLVKLAATFPTDPTVQLGMAGTLRLVSINDAAADLVVTAGGLSALMNASRTHAKRADVQRAFVGALLELSAHGFAEQVVGAEGISSVIKAAETHAKEERLQARAAGVIRLLGVNDECKAQITELNGVAMLIGAAKRFPQSGSVQADVAGALAVLAVDDALEVQIADADGIALLLDSLQRHKQSAAVSAHVWHALTNLSVAETTKAQLLEAATLSTLLGGALTQHENAPRVVEGVSTTIRNLLFVNDGGGHPQADKLVPSASLQQLHKVLTKHSGKALIAVAIAGAMRTLAANPTCAMQLSKSGAPATLQACSEAHRDDERLQKEVASCLRRMEDAAGGGGGGARASSAENGSAKKVPKAKTAKPGEKKGKLESKIKV